MAAFADDFDEVPEFDPAAPLLPREDRLWRHPSELGAGNSSYAVDPVAVRSRWLQSQPSRASVWTAGLVGALLATGLVALGPRLAPTLARSPNVTNSSATQTTPTVLDSSTLPASSLGQALAVSLASSIRAISQEMALVSISSAGSVLTCLGLIVRGDGMVLIPAANLAHATSVLVSLPNGGPTDVGHLVGMDASSGLAVVRIEGMNGHSSASIPTSSSMAVASFALAVTAPTGASVALGQVRALNVSSGTGANALVDTIQTDIPAASAPLGSVLIDPSGHISGLVTAMSSLGAVATPSWMMGPVLDQLLATGAVSHGWLGINGASASPASAPSGVDVLTVGKKSAASEAGIRQGDLIVAIDGTAVSSMTALRGRLYVLPAGTPITLRIVRANHRLTVHATLNDHES